MPSWDVEMEESCQQHGGICCSLTEALVLGLFMLMDITLGERLGMVGVRTAMRMNSDLENMTQEGRLEIQEFLHLDQRENWRRKPSGIRRKFRKVSKFHLFLCSFWGGQGVAGSN